MNDCLFAVDRNHHKNPQPVKTAENSLDYRVSIPHRYIYNPTLDSRLEEQLRGVERL